MTSKKLYFSKVTDNYKTSIHHSKKNFTEHFTNSDGIDLLRINYLNNTVKWFENKSNTYKDNLVEITEVNEIVLLERLANMCRDLNQVKLFYKEKYEKILNNYRLALQELDDN